MREISLLKDIEHESIVALYDVVVADNNLYLVFEYLNMDLKKLLDRGKDLFTPMLVKVLHSRYRHTSKTFNHHPRNRCRATCTKCCRPSRSVTCIASCIAT